MHDLDKVIAAHWKTSIDFEPDMTCGPLIFAEALEALDFEQLRLAGHGLPADSPFQLPAKLGKYEKYKPAWK